MAAAETALAAGYTEHMRNLPRKPADCWAGGCCVRCGLRAGGEHPSGAHRHDAGRRGCLGRAVQAERARDAAARRARAAAGQGREDDRGGTPERALPPGRARVHDVHGLGRRQPGEPRALPGDPTALWIVIVSPSTRPVRSSSSRAAWPSRGSRAPRRARSPPRPPRARPRAASGLTTRLPSRSPTPCRSR